MSDSLLPYYERELAAIRGLAGEFAAANPKIAGRLRLSGDAVDDPHVARLLEGVAFLAARVHHRLDDEFPELTDALLETLYPHYLAPVPSCTIVQFARGGGRAGARPPSPPAACWTPNRCVASRAGSAPPRRPPCGQSGSRRRGCPACPWPRPANPQAVGPGGVARGGGAPAHHRLHGALR